MVEQVRQNFEKAMRRSTAKAKYYVFMTVSPLQETNKKITAYK